MSPTLAFGVKKVSTDLALTIELSNVFLNLIMFIYFDEDYIEALHAMSVAICTTRRKGKPPGGKQCTVFQY